VVTSTTTTSYDSEPYPTPTTSPLAIVFFPSGSDNFYSVLLDSGTGVYEVNYGNPDYEAVRYIFLEPNGFLFDANEGTYFNVGGGDFANGGQLLRQSDGTPDKPAGNHFGFGDGIYVYYDPNGVKLVTCVRYSDNAVTFREPDADTSDCSVGDLEGLIFG